MKFPRSLRNRRGLYILLIIMALIMGALALQYVFTSADVDPMASDRPTVAPISTSAFALVPTIVAPEYLELEPVEVDPFGDIEDCDPYWVQNEVLAEATNESPEIKIECHLTLSPRDVVTKRLIFEKSGVTLECNGAKITGGDGTPGNLKNINYNKDMIEVRSPSSLVDGERVWQRPRSITIRGCSITGSVRVWGMAKNGEGNPAFSEGDENPLKTSSRQEGHTERVRANAPTDIIFDDIIVTGVGRNPVYFAPGVTFSKLINSVLTGRSDGVAIYLDAESYANTIKNNKIDVSTLNKIFESKDLPLIAIDGSSHNKILNNWFTNLSHGGIYLYRNCGEGGVVRHATPSHNQIINNIFYYNKYQGSNPSVYFGSRDGDRNYCNKDADSDFGSGVSNKDFATHNVVMQNQIFKRSVSDMIKTNSPSINSPNFVDYNHTVSDDTVVYNGLAGCYLADWYRDFVPHGFVVDVFRGSNDIPTCTDYRDTCDDGELRRTLNPGCQLTTEEFDCSVTGSNGGCSQTASCPAGQSIIAAIGACNLEWGTISDAALSAVPVNILKVYRASDAVSSGRCNMGGFSLHEGEKQIDGIYGSFAVNVGCKEYDKNGGDCQIRGVLYCR